jgi:3-hydroxyisobutyrate dehydrogenase
VLEVFGTPNRFGPLGSGAAMKLVLNSTLGAVLVGVGEALAVGDALGLDRSVVLDALEGSYLGTMVKTKRGMLDSREFPPQFKLSLAAKDLRLVEAAAPGLRGVAVAREAFDRAEREGHGDEDYAVLIEQLERSGDATASR